MIKGFLIDIDGVLLANGVAIEGTVECFNQLRKQYPLRLLTNTTRKSTEALYNQLKRLGFRVEQEEIFSPPKAVQTFLREENIQRIRLVGQRDLEKDFKDFELTSSSPEAIIIGDINRDWTHKLLDELFVDLLQGTQLIALHQNRFTKRQESFSLDIGPFVKALEYAANVQAKVIGKPNAAFFQLALKCLHIAEEDVLMIGDDIDSDIGAAQAIGIKGALVKTGKYNKSYVENSTIQPQYVWESFLDIKQYL